MWAQHAPVSPVWAQHADYVRPEWLDGNGHMNLAYYVLVFDRGTDAWLHMAGMGADYRQASRCSVFAVEAHTLYRQEVRLDAKLLVRTCLVGMDERRLHLMHEMLSDAAPVAMQEVMFLHVDLTTRRAAPMVTQQAARVQAMLPPPGWQRPEWLGRGVGHARAGGLRQAPAPAALKQR